MAHLNPSGFWNIPQNKFNDLTGEKARDLILDCFFFAQKETFAHAKEKLGMPASDDAVRKSVRTVVEKAFVEIGASFEQPTRETLQRLVELLARKSLAWGMPHDVVEHHRKQIETMLKRVPDDIPF